MALAKALQCCAGVVGSSSQYNVWHSLRPAQMPLPLIQLDEEDIWEASLLESVGGGACSFPDLCRGCPTAW